MIWFFEKDIRTWLPQLQAHRGYWVAGAPPNTLNSIMEAFKRGFAMSEFDLRLTLDQQVILFHDSKYEGKNINQYTLSELRLKLPITTFDELLLWFSKTENYKLNIEIKSHDIFNYILEQKVARLIRDYVVEDRVLISSFNPFSLFKIRLCIPRVRRALLLTFENEPGNNFLVKSLLLNWLCHPHMLNLRFNDYSAKFRALAKKIPIVLWTVNDPEIYKKYKSEIHGIISDSITPAELSN